MTEPIREDGLSSVVDAGLVHSANIKCWNGIHPVGGFSGARSSDTLLGFETTARLFPGPCVGWEGLLLPCFGGGVWCLICG